MAQNKLKSRVVEDIIVRITLDGSFQGAKLYKANIAGKEKEAFRKSIAAELNITLQSILSKERYSDKLHYEAILDFANRISNKHANILKDGRLRIGIAQKLINLYWKFSWLLKPSLNPPIHCPFDSIVIKGLDKSVQNITWTTLNSITDYEKLVKAAAYKAKDNTSIAEWELGFYYQRVNYSYNNGLV